MFCQQCGAKIDTDCVFCTECGAKQIAVTTTPDATSSVHGTQTQPTFNEQPQQFNPQMNSQFNQQPNQSFNSNGSQQTSFTQFTPPDTSFNGTAGNTDGSPKRVSFGEAIKLYFKNYVNFTGRSTASEYWWSFLFQVLVCMIPIVGQFVALALIIPSLSISVRRLHDTGKPWYYMFMGLIPIAGLIILIIQYCKESDGDNAWGPAAKN